MHDSHDDVIYVGKAVNLKRRVSSYFRNSTKHSTKIESMVSKVSRFEYILTDSELEALILECNLIKEYRPRYNTMLMDDKAYPYICVTVITSVGALSSVYKSQVLIQFYLFLTARNGCSKLFFNARIYS